MLLIPGISWKLAFAQLRVAAWAPLFYLDHTDQGLQATT